MARENICVWSGGIAITADIDGFVADRFGCAIPQEVAEDRNMLPSDRIDAGEQREIRCLTDRPPAASVAAAARSALAIVSDVATRRRTQIERRGDLPGRPGMKTRADHDILRFVREIALSGRYYG